MPTWPLVDDDASTLADGGDTAAARAVPRFLGFGILLPLRRDQKSDFAAGGDTELIRSNIRQVLGTQARAAQGGGELPWRTDFGSLLHLLRHRKNDFVLSEIARSYIVDALRAWEPRVMVLDVTSLVDPKQPRTRTLRVRYNVIDQNQRHDVIARDQIVDIELV